MAEPFAPFAGRRYLNLQTFRRSGAAVSTPVWFAAQADRLYVYSLARAGKVKRIRNDARVRIAPCNAFGKIEGEWVEAQGLYAKARARPYEEPRNPKHGSRPTTRRLPRQPKCPHAAPAEPRRAEPAMPSRRAEPVLQGVPAALLRDQTRRFRAFDFLLRVGARATANAVASPRKIRAARISRSKFSRTLGAASRVG